MSDVTSPLLGVISVLLIRARFYLAKARCHQFVFYPGEMQSRKKPDCMVGQCFYETDAPVLFTKQM
ncbi:hypothetical protein EG028_04205 [Chitinophaga barathri]|uniref:Uncharacterized protein n=1 Tax=Chitinophaga barathri TaxID=1647451 RepID=A0A3N4MKD8_9BACT|nr:hypothetical protein EG028_04205 [Chitinophaga barathri]